MNRKIYRFVEVNKTINNTIIIAKKPFVENTGGFFS